jgi:hypothetical protein
MNDDKLMEYIDHQRWLLNCGLLNDNIKNQLFMYGTIVHRETRAVELSVDVDKKIVHYEIYIDDNLIKKVNKYKELSSATDILGLWRFKKLLKKEGNLNFDHLLGKFVKDFCGPKWNVEVSIIDYKKYKDSFGDVLSESDKPSTITDK